MIQIGYPSPEAIAFLARKRFLNPRCDPSLVVETFLIDNLKQMICSIADFDAEFVKAVTASKVAVAIIVLAGLAAMNASHPEAPDLLARVTLVAFSLSLVGAGAAVIASPVPQIVMVDVFLWSLFLRDLLACYGAAYPFRVAYRRMRSLRPGTS